MSAKTSRSRNKQENVFVQLVSCVHFRQNCDFVNFHANKRGAGRPT